MQVTQPNEFYKGLPKEDVFFVKDDQNNPVGEGFLIYQYQPTIFPSRPVNIYFSMTSKPEGEYWLLGSLAARARQLTFAADRPKAQQHLRHTEISKPPGKR